MDASRGRRGTHVYKHCFFNIPTNMHALHKQIATTVQSSYNLLCKHRANIARSICRQSASTVQSSYNFTMQLLRKHRTLKLSPKRKHRAISHAQSVAQVQAPRKYRTLNVPTKCKRCASIVRSICRQSTNTVQTTPFLPTFLHLSLQNLPFNPSSCSRRSQNG